MNLGLNLVDVRLDNVTLHGISLRKVLIDALKGVGATQADEAAGLAKFSGNQHNEAWTFSDSALEVTSTQMLAHIYANRRQQKEAAAARAGDGRGSGA